MFYTLLTSHKLEGIRHSRCNDTAFAKGTSSVLSTTSRSSGPITAFGQLATDEVLVYLLHGRKHVVFTRNRSVETYITSIVTGVFSEFDSATSKSG